MDWTPEKITIALMCKNGRKQPQIAREYGLKVSQVRYIWKLYRDEVEAVRGRKCRARPISRKGDGVGIRKKRRRVVRYE